MKNSSSHLYIGKASAFLPISILQAPSIEEAQAYWQKQNTAPYLTDRFEQDQKLFVISKTVPPFTISQVLNLAYVVANSHHDALQAASIALSTPATELRSMQLTTSEPLRELFSAKSETVTRYDRHDWIIKDPENRVLKGNNLVIEVKPAC